MSKTKERPIRFAGPMVRAILDGHKTQTRRVIKPQPTSDHGLVFEGIALGKFGKKTDREIMSPFGVPGDRLWVKEAFRTWAQGVEYRADDEGSFGWTPSTRMPRWASRITLEITDVRVERVQEINDGDALAEGVKLRGITRYEGEARGEFAALWDSIYAKRGLGWGVNPWVFVIDFRRVDQGDENG